MPSCARIRRSSPDIWGGGEGFGGAVLQARRSGRSRLGSSDDSSDDSSEDSSRALSKVTRQETSHAKGWMKSRLVWSGLVWHAERVSRAGLLPMAELAREQERAGGGAEYIRYIYMYSGVESARSRLPDVVSVLPYNVYSTVQYEYVICVICVICILRGELTPIPRGSRKFSRRGGGEEGRRLAGGEGDYWRG
jgi:hypothetical protein